MRPIVKVRGLTKEFRVLGHRRGLVGAARNLFSNEARTVRAVDNISFDIKPGEFVGYVGPNGAGKSTTVKSLVGILRPTSGELSVLGRDPQRHRTENAFQMGVVFGQRTQLWWDLPVVESFSLLSRVYRIAPDAFRQRFEDLSGRLDLESFLDVPVRKLSLGQRMRCEIAAAVLHSPELLFLDEPTIGLDVLAKKEVRDFLQQVNAETGTTVVLTSHDLDDIERLCSRVIVIDHGQILHDGTVESLRRIFGHRRILSLQIDPSSSEKEEAVIDLPSGVTMLERSPEKMRLEFDPARTSAPELLQLVMAKAPVTDLHVSDRDIEEVVREIYSREAGPKEER